MDLEVLNQLKENILNKKEKKYIEEEKKIILFKTIKEVLVNYI